MRQKAGTPKSSAETVIKDIRRVTRKQYETRPRYRGENSVPSGEI
jgi:hypothetical protein